MALNTHTFTGSSLNFTFQRGDSYPFTPSIQRVQTQGETEGGKLYVQDRGQENIIYTLTFERMSQTDKNNLVNFWQTDAVGSLNTFTWNDLTNTNHTVRMMNNPLDIIEVGHDGGGSVFDVVLVLREEV